MLYFSYFINVDNVAIPEVFFIMMAATLAFDCADFIKHQTGRR